MSTAPNPSRQERDPSASSSFGAFGADGLRIWSCVICRRRKVRCDRHEPCANCIRNGIECHYPVTGRLPRRRGPQAGPNSSAAERHANLIRRLRRLEAVVTELSAQVEEGAKGQEISDVSVQIPLRPPPSRATDSPLARVAGSPQTSSMETVSHQESSDWGAPSSTLGTNWPSGGSVPEEGDEDFGRLVVARNGVLTVGNRFWTVFCDEVDSIFRAVEDVEMPSESSSLAADLRDHDGTFSAEHSHDGYEFIMPGMQPATHNRPLLRPSPQQMAFLWDIYVANVDPFIKILHTKSLGQTIHSLQGDYSTTLTAELNTLLSAASLASAYTLSDDQAVAEFGLSKAQLIAALRASAEQGFTTSKILTTKSLTLLQAFTIYLSMLPFISVDNASWPLTGLLLRLATSMRLHRDPTHYPDIPLVDAEIRRRLWWQICFIDSQSREGSVPQLSISEAMFDTSKPADIGDDDFEKPLPPLDSSNNRNTNMSLFLFRCEIWRLGRAIEQNRDKPERMQLRLVQESENITRSSLINSSHPATTFHSLVKTMASLFYSKAGAVIYNRAFRRASQGEPVPQDLGPRQHIFRQLMSLSLDIIESTYLLKTNPSWSGWRWQFRGNVPWNAMGIVLTQLSNAPWDEVSERAWRPTKALFDAVDDTQRHEKTWSSVNYLMTLAQKVRDEWISRTSGHTHPTAGDQAGEMQPAATSEVVEMDLASGFLGQPTSIEYPGLGDSANTWLNTEEPMPEIDLGPWLTDDSVGLELFWDMGASNSM